MKITLHAKWLRKLCKKEDGWEYFIYFMNVFLQQGEILRLLHSCRTSYPFVEVKHEKKLDTIVDSFSV